MDEQQNRQHSAFISLFDPSEKETILTAKQSKMYAVIT